MINNSITKTARMFCPFALSLLFGAGCTTSSFRPEEPNTVLINYHVKPGKEKELEDVLRQAWDVYCDERMVVKQPPICLLDRDETGPVITETYTLRGPFVMEYPSSTVQKLWEKMHSLCEKREKDGIDIDIRYVELIPINNKVGS